jgi:hypothetical protein
VVIDQKGNLQHEILIEEPTSVVAGTDMVVIGGRGGFAAYERDGTFVGAIGGPHGRDLHEFDTVSGLVIDNDDNVYVVDTYNNRMSKHNKEGELIWRNHLGIPANAGITPGREMTAEEIQKNWPSAMQVPAGLTIDGAGRLCIVDNLDYSIAVFDRETGEFLAKYGSHGMEDGQLYFPNDIAYDHVSDYYVVTEPSWGRLQIISLPGSSASAIAGIGRTFNDLLRSCCWPLLIILLAIAIWAATKRYRRYRDEKEERENAEHALSVAGLEPLDEWQSDDGHAENGQE